MIMRNMRALLVDESFIVIASDSRRPFRVLPVSYFATDIHAAVDNAIHQRDPVCQ